MSEEVLCVIFMDLQKAYGALERDIYLEILEGYSVGTQACRLLWTDWGWMQMVARAGGYYGSDFKGFRGVK